MGKSIRNLSTVTRVGLDLAKRVFQVHAVEAKGEIVVARKLTPGQRRWKAVGGDRVHQCTFCRGGPTEAVVGCPDSDVPILWQVAVCRECIADLIMTRFAAVKHRRTMALAKDLSAAADEIVKRRDDARWNKRVPAELRAEELHIREKFGLLEDPPLRDVTRRGSPLH